MPNLQPRLFLADVRQQPALKKRQIVHHEQRRQNGFRIVHLGKSHISGLESVDGGEHPMHEEVKRCGYTQTFSLSEGSEQDGSVSC